MVASTINRAASPSEMETLLDLIFEEFGPQTRIGFLRVCIREFPEYEAPLRGHFAALERDCRKAERSVRQLHEDYLRQRWV